MIKKVTVTNHLGEAVEMSLMEPEKSGFIILDIQGLDPAKADINTTEIVSSDGATYNSARVTKRNIVFSLKFREKPTIEATRLLSYKYFPIKRPITIKIETDSRIAETVGYVESNDINIFSNGEKAQISVICPSAYFVSTTKRVSQFTGLTPLFEFPFSNESLTEKLIEMGTIDHILQNSVVYEGDGQVGAIFVLHAIGTVVNPVITNVNTRESIKVDTVRLALLTGSGMIAGDDIIISTVRDDKYIYLIRNGEVINIFNCLDKDADWFQLEKGDNPFVYTADSGIEDLQFRIENQVLYEGL